jgi:hypothetical protein
MRGLASAPRARETKTVKQLGWEQVRNGALLRLAATQFDVFITVDTNLPYQQNADNLEAAVIVLRGRPPVSPTFTSVASPAGCAGGTAIWRVSGSELAGSPMKERSAAPAVTHH